MEIASEFDPIPCVPAGDRMLDNDSTVFKTLTTTKDYVGDEVSRAIIVKAETLKQYPSMEETPFEKIQIRDFPIADNHLLNEDSQYSIEKAHFPHQTEMSQFLLDEFQRASLLEEDAELPMEIKEMRNTAGKSKEQQPLVEFNLSDELLPSQKHIYIRPKAPVPGVYRGRLGIQSSGICPPNTDKAKQSPFVFTATNVRPRTAGTSKALHRGATSRPHTASPSFHSYRTDQQRPEDHETGEQPALIITSAALVQCSHQQSFRQHTVVTQRQASGSDGGAKEGDAVQAPPETSGASSTTAAATVIASPSHSPMPEQVISASATRKNAPAKEPVYSLRKPHRPVHGRLSAGGQPPRSASFDVQGKHYATTATKPPSETTSSGNSKPSSLPYVKLDPAVAESQQQGTVLQLSKSPAAAGSDRKAKPHGKMHTVQMHPDCLPDLGASKNEHADIQITAMHIDTAAFFAPAKPIPAKIPLLDLNSPAFRQRLDLARMAAQVERMIEDPDYIPAPTPLVRAQSGRDVDSSGARRSSKDEAHKDSLSPAWLRDVTPRLPASSRSPEQSLKSPRKVLHIVPSAPAETSEAPNAVGAGIGDVPVPHIP